MLSRVDDLTSQPTAPPAMVVARLRDVVINDEVHLPVRRGLPPRAFRRVLEYILAHLAEDISNPVLAELVGLSPSHFSRAFKQSAGVSPHSYVLQSRVERVKHLLVETRLPLAQIAISVGFADQSHCTRWFRELVGVTPGRFRWLNR